MKPEGVTLALCQASISAWSGGGTRSLKIFRNQNCKKVVFNFFSFLQMKFIPSHCSLLQQYRPNFSKAFKILRSEAGTDTVSSSSALFKILFWFLEARGAWRGDPGIVPSVEALHGPGSGTYSKIKLQKVVFNFLFFCKQILHRIF